MANNIGSYDDASKFGDAVLSEEQASSTPTTEPAHDDDLLGLSSSDQGLSPNPPKEDDEQQFLTQSFEASNAGSGGGGLDLSDFSEQERRIKDEMLVNTDFSQHQVGENQDEMDFLNSSSKNLEQDFLQQNLEMSTRSDFSRATEMEQLDFSNFSGAPVSEALGDSSVTQSDNFDLLSGSGNDALGQSTDGDVLGDSTEQQQSQEIWAEKRLSEEEHQAQVLAQESAPEQTDELVDLDSTQNAHVEDGLEQSQELEMPLSTPEDEGLQKPAEESEPVDTMVTKTEAAPEIEANPVTEPEPEPVQEPEAQEPEPEPEPEVVQEPEPEPEPEPPVEPVAVDEPPSENNPLEYSQTMDTTTTELEASEEVIEVVEDDEPRTDILSPQPEPEKPGFKMVANFGSVNEDLTTAQGNEEVESPKEETAPTTEESSVAENTEEGENEMRVGACLLLLLLLSSVFSFSISSIIFGLDGRGCLIYFLPKMFVYLKRLARLLLL